MTATSLDTTSRPTTTNRLSNRFSFALQDISTMLWRDTVRTTRQPEMLVFAVVMGAFFLVLFNYVFGGAIGAGAGVDYLQFLVPGSLSSPHSRVRNKQAWDSPPTWLRA